MAGRVRPQVITPWKRLRSCNGLPCIGGRNGSGELGLSPSGNTANQLPTCPPSGPSVGALGLPTQMPQIVWRKATHVCRLSVPEVQSQVMGGRDLEEAAGPCSSQHGTMTPWLITASLLQQTPVSHDAPPICLCPEHLSYFNDFSTHRLEGPLNLNHTCQGPQGRS